MQCLDCVQCIHCIVSGDVKDFYYSGDQFDLAKLVGQAEDDPSLRPLLVDMALHCLCNQYLKVDGFAFRVRTGSSQGFTCSGEILDWAFYLDLEQSTVYNEEWRRQHGVLWYGRYRGDTLWLIRPSAATRRLTYKLALKHVCR